MKLYNQLTRRIDEVTSLEADRIRVYTCGPTVYDHAHIGNLSSYIFADTLRRALALAGFGVVHAMNFTDIEDKIIKRIHARYPDMEPLAAMRKLTEEYISLFMDDMRQVGNDIEAFTFLKATETIQEMKELISKLYDKGFAYAADDGIYFSIEAYRKSGKTYGQLLELTETNTSAARIQNDEYDKDSIHDFSLWKKQKPGEPAWEFSLDGHDMTGRPGWHIECSVMSRLALGQPFDIHTGGIDLIFPHHENEIAQSTALEDNPTMATCFVHNEHILVDGKKMAKSAQNFFTLQDIADHGHEAIDFRLLVLQGHYRKQVNFTWESLQAAHNRLVNLRAFADLRLQTIDVDRDMYDFDAARDRVVTAMHDDLDSPRALAILSEIEGEVSARLVSRSEQAAFERFLETIDGLFGLQLLASAGISAEQRQLIADRQVARDSKDFARADELRAQLDQQGLNVRDTAFGSIWSRK